MSTAPAKRPRDSINPGDPVVVPSPSASLVLLAPLEKRTKDGYDYRVLLLKRNARSSTFMSAHVFPGGNVDPIDKDVDAWSRLYPSFKQMSGEEKRMLVMKLCAARETFEECGVLLLEGSEEAKSRWAAVPEDERRKWRTRVHDSGPVFLELLKMLEGDSTDSVRPGLSLLQYRANWITPANQKRRFDTCFFVSVLPPASRASHNATESPHQELEGPSSHTQSASADNTEMISADWLTPHEAIRKTLAHTAGLMQSSPGSSDASGSSQQPATIVLFPPQFYLLAELVRYKSWRDLLDTPAAGETALVRPRRVATFEPEIQSVLDARGVRRAATVLVGDPAHSKTDKSTAKPDDRHRTYVLLPLKPEQKADERWKAKAPLGLTVMGVHRQGMTRLFGPGWEDMKEGDVGEGPNSVPSHL